MCNLTTKIKNCQSVTGYKIVYKENGKYFSPATGIEYKENIDLPWPNNIKNKIKYYFGFDDVLNANELSHHKNLYGKTAVFINLSDAMIFANIWQTAQEKMHLQIVKMTLSNDLYNGIYGFNSKVYIGSHIDKIEEIN